MTVQVDFDLNLSGSTGFVDDVGDVLMEALMAHPRITDPMIGGCLTSGLLHVTFELEPEP